MSVGHRAGHIARRSKRSRSTTASLMLVYGSRSDWVQNVLAAGTATLEIGGETVDLVGPEVITADEAFKRLPPGPNVHRSC